MTTDRPGDAAVMTRVIPDGEMAGGFPAGVLRALAEIARSATPHRPHQPPVPFHQETDENG